MGFTCAARPVVRTRKDVNRRTIGWVGPRRCNPSRHADQGPVTPCRRFQHLIAEPIRTCLLWFCGRPAPARSFWLLSGPGTSFAAGRAAYQLQPSIASLNIDHTGHGLPVFQRNDLLRDLSEVASRRVRAETCGVMLTYGIRQNGCVVGSGSSRNTSSTARATRPSSMARQRSSSTRCSPRPTLITTASDLQAKRGRSDLF